MAVPRSDGASPAQRRGVANYHEGRCGASAPNKRSASPFPGRFVAESLAGNHFTRRVGRCTPSVRSWLGCPIAARIAEANGAATGHSVRPEIFSQGGREVREVFGVRAATRRSNTAQSTPSPRSARSNKISPRGPSRPPVLPVKPGSRLGVRPKHRPEGPLSNQGADQARSWRTAAETSLPFTTAPRDFRCFIATPVA